MPSVVCDSVVFDNQPSSIIIINIIITMASEPPPPNNKITFGAEFTKFMNACFTTYHDSFLVSMHKVVLNLLEHQFPESLLYHKDRHKRAFADSILQLADQTVFNRLPEPTDEEVARHSPHKLDQLGYVFHHHQRLLLYFTDKYNEFSRGFERDVERLNFFNHELKHLEPQQNCYNYPIALKAVGWHLRTCFGMLLLFLSLDLTIKFLEQLKEVVHMSTGSRLYKFQESAKVLSNKIKLDYQYLLNDNPAELLLEGGALYKQMIVSRASRGLQLPTADLLPSYKGQYAAEMNKGLDVFHQKGLKPWQVELMPIDLVITYFEPVPERFFKNAKE